MSRLNWVVSNALNVYECICIVVSGGRKNYNIESVIYRFDDVNDKFLPFQCISTQGAYKWVTYSVSRLWSGN